VLVFLMLRLTPGDPAAILAGDAASSEQIAEIRASLGLDRPLPVQFAIWIGNLARGELGQSYFYKMQVTQLIGQRLEPTMALATLTIFFAVIVSIPLGVLAAWRFGGWFDRALMGFSVLGFSVPVFVLAYILIWIVSLQLGWFPVQGYRRLADGLLPFLHHLILPALTLSVIYIALIARVTRASVLEALGEDYVRTARAKGLRERAVTLRHAARNAMIPTMIYLGLGFGGLLAGTVITETIFSWPGLGRYAFHATKTLDFPAIMSVTTVIAVIYVTVNLVVDVLQVLIDPRVRVG
jgi:peptide/nickel transport system permease protein